MPSRGFFVTLEGIDRSGKSTQARLLAEALGPETLLLREPGGTEVGERVRALIKDPGVLPSPQAEALLFAAARSQLARDVIEPALADGRTVVCDRFLDSSLAYQGSARGLGLQEVRAINRFGIGPLEPDLTILLDIDPVAAAGRAGELDPFESEGIRLQEQVRGGYRELARAEPERWRVVDAANAAEDVQAEVLEVVRTRLAHGQGRR